jgi:hypothetical protein
MNKYKMKKIAGGAMVIGFIVLTLSCGQSRQELLKKQDSLFLGISLGMESKAFYDHCWEYNRRKIFTHGPSNQNVEYRLDTIVNSSVSMRFYPTFIEDKIFEMPVTFTYEAWAPWNRQYHSDSLLVQMIKVFKVWYGDDFKELNHPTQGKVYYRIDGRRRINLFIKDDQFVQAVFTDLRVERELKKKMEEQATTK